MPRKPKSRKSTSRPHPSHRTTLTQRSPKTQLTNVLNLYNTASTTDFLGPGPSQIVRHHWTTTHLRRNLQRFCKCIVPASVQALFGPTTFQEVVLRHLRYRYPVYFGEPQYDSLKKGRRTVLPVLGDSMDTIRKERAQLENEFPYDSPASPASPASSTRPPLAKCRYAIVGKVPLDATCPQRPQTDDDQVWFIHTWGINMNEPDVDQQFVLRMTQPKLHQLQRKQPFYGMTNQHQWNRYKALLDITFDTIRLSLNHIHRVENREVVLRITSLGFGAWATHIGPRDGPYYAKCIRAYKQHLETLVKDFKWLTVLHPSYPEETTYRVHPAPTPWTPVENHHDPFGGTFKGKQAFPLAKKVLVIVNAWDNGSWIGNGGSRDDTMDGWTVAGGSRSFRPCTAITPNRPLGFQVKTPCYLHNVVFQPGLLDTRGWILH